MGHYSNERKEVVLKKLLPPHNLSAPQVAKEEDLRRNEKALAETALVLRKKLNALWEEDGAD